MFSKKVFFLLASIIVISSCKEVKKDNSSIKQENQKKPNIIYILADDMGYGDISALNQNSGIQTPNIDNLVETGVHFTDAHTNSAVCTPTRYGILTGRYAWRSRLKTGVLWGYDQPLIEENRPTVASFLKSNGYTTACIGKWHLGLGWQAKDINKPIAKYEWDLVFEEGADSNVDFTKKVSGPNELGFDYSYIIPSSLDMTPYLYLENGKAVELPTSYTAGKSQDKDGRGVIWRPGEVAPDFVFENVLDNITKKTVSFIDEQKDEETPFFLYFPLTAPHTPWLPIGDANGKSEAGRYGDFVTMVDDAVGAVVKALEESGKLDNTLIIVTSDNGAHWTPEDKKNYDHRANHSYKGQKADIYEGGHRVPFIAKWTGVIPKGHQSNQTICTTDLLGTVAAIVNKPLADNEGPDSFNLWPAFTDTIDTPIRASIIHHSLDGFFAIRKGKWKYTPRLGSGGFSVPKQIEPRKGEALGSLYDMEKDPEEQYNLYLENAEIVKQLSDLLEVQKQQGYTRHLNK